MLILEKPYVSDMLINMAVSKQLPILYNAMSEQLKNQGYSLNLQNDVLFEQSYRQKGRMYTMSENALEWIYKHFPESELTEKISLLKDKAAFRRLCRHLYPDFYFQELSLEELYAFPTAGLKLPLVIKPSVGFLSAGVYVIQNQQEWNNALTDIKNNFENVSRQFPDFVVGSHRFLLEEYIHGDEFAVDVYFDEEKKPVILNIFHHRFASDNDVSDRLYCTSKSIYDQYFNKFYDFLVSINAELGLHDFPMHIEFRYNGKMAIPIEINPMRFAGFCLNELQAHISGLHPVAAYLDNIHPDYEKMWAGKENDVFSFLVFEQPADLPAAARLDEEKLKAAFSHVLELRPVKASVGVLATMFSQTDHQHLAELDQALILDMHRFVKY